MTDHELLELAAKAAGLDLNLVKGWDGWNPLIDDGDALRLAVKLGISVKVRPYRDCTDAIIPHLASSSCSHSKNNLGAYVATRLAIVRVAAEIGKRHA